MLSSKCRSKRRREMNFKYFIKSLGCFYFYLFCFYSSLLFGFPLSPLHTLTRTHTHTPIVCIYFFSLTLQHRPEFRFPTQTRTISISICICFRRCTQLIDLCISTFVYRTQPKRVYWFCKINLSDQKWLNLSKMYNAYTINIPSGINLIFIVVKTIYPIFSIAWLFLDINVLVGFQNKV